jgi:hypothetical protein
VATKLAAGLDVNTPPCFTQKEQPHARAGIALDSPGHSSEKVILPQWHLPLICTEISGLGQSRPYKSTTEFDPVKTFNASQQPRPSAGDQRRRSKQAELDQLLSLAQQLSQKKTSDFAVLDRQSEEQIVAAILEFELPNVHRETFLVQLGYKSRRIAMLKARCELRTEAVEHRRGDIGLEGRVPFSDECTPRPALGRRKHFLKHCFDIWRRLSPPDLRSDTQEKRKAKKKTSRS